MADPQSYRPAPGAIPKDPGVYRFRDKDRRVIYVGKAKSLRARLSNYFRDPATLHPRTRVMVYTATSVEWTVVASEVEALQLEYTWIKRYAPYFNVQFRDDKSYPMLAVSTAEEFPRVFVYRGAKRPGVRYFGPYAHVRAIKDTLDCLTRVFRLRTCLKGKFNSHKLLGRPCLNGYIDRCSAPCVGRISPQDYRVRINDFMAFMNGRTDALVASLTTAMHDAANNLDFEQAARLRDDLEAIHSVMERQSVVFNDGTDADVIGVAQDELETAIYMFHIRAGRIRGQRGWVVEADPEHCDDTLAECLIQFYGDHHDQNTTEKATTLIPRTILVPFLPADSEKIAEWLATVRKGPVRIHVPQRGDKASLIEITNNNAREALKQHRLKRNGDLTQRSAALTQLQDVLGMKSAPLRIECTDISHIQGTDVVASLVVFEDALPKKSDYRRYAIKEAAGGGHSNDVASVAEVTRRRFRTYGEHSDNSSPQHDYPPQLFIVDGGAPQVASAYSVFSKLGITDVTLIGLAKRLEEVWLPGEEYPLILPRTSPALYLLQQIRDEAHRFAITFHRAKRSARMTHSVLDDLHGIGEKRRKELIKHFGSVHNLKEASVDRISEVSGFGPKLAASVYEQLHHSR